MVGSMTDQVYSVEGGMEDWVYGVGWENQVNFMFNLSTIDLLIKQKKCHLNLIVNYQIKLRINFNCKKKILNRLKLA